jgi:large subunit ribosomal protein L16
MLQPKRTRYRKPHRGDRRGKALNGNTVDFGDWGIQAMGPAWIDSRQIEAARRAITHHIKRGGKVWIRIFPDKSVTAKPAETRMGSGKGAPDHWVAVVKPGRIMFELAGVDETTARESLRLAQHKLSVRTRIVEREGGAVGEMLYARKRPVPTEVAVEAGSVETDEAAGAAESETEEATA